MKFFRVDLQRYTPYLQVCKKRIIFAKKECMIDVIERKICEYFKVDRDDLISKSHSLTASLARGFLWYILHYDCGMSANAIAKHYQRNIRSVKKLVAKTKYLATTQKEYEGHYKTLSV